MRASSMIVLLAAASALLPAGAAAAVWWAGGQLDVAALPERALWAVGAASVTLVIMVFVAGAAGRAFDPESFSRDDVDHLGGDPVEGEPLTEDELLDLLPPTDLAGLSRAADAIAAEIRNPPGPALKRFLAFARPARPRRRRVHLNSVIAVAIDALRNGHHEVGLKLSFDPDPGVDRVPIDPDALHRAIVNLVRNAREAAGPSGEIEVRTQSLGDRVLVAVRDDGPGVPREHLERIFQPFFTTRKGAMGLGLSICRQIAEAHGGSIAAMNILPRGLEVGLELPLSRLPLLSPER